MKYILCLLLMVMATIAKAQTEKEVQSFFDEYSQLMVNREFARSLDLVYPDLYTLIPRKEMEDAILSVLNDSSMFKMSFKEMKISNISQVFTTEKVSYNIVDYSITTVMDFINPETTQEEVFHMGGIFNDIYGKENFVFGEKQFIVTTHNRMATIKPKGAKKLYMLEINDEMRPLIKQLLGDDFVEKAF